MMSMANLWGKNGRMIQNGTVMQKQNSGTKNGTVVQKRNSGSKTHCSVFCSVVKRKEQKCKNGTVVQKHTVLLWKKQNSSAKNGTVVRKHGTVIRKHTLPFFVLLWKTQNRSAKTEQCYKNTLFREKTEKVVQKKRVSGTKTRNSDTKTHCSVFLFRCEKKTEKKCKNSRGTKTHCYVFVPLW